LARVGVGGDALVAGDVGAGLAVDEAEGALLEDIIKMSWSHSVRTRAAAVSGPASMWKVSVAIAADGADARGGGVDLDGV
jgi:hypothetical protein